MSKMPVQNDRKKQYKKLKNRNLYIKFKKKLKL